MIYKDFFIDVESKKHNIVMKIRFMFLLDLFFMACSTSEKFVLPAGLNFSAHKRPVTPEANGILAMKLIFWTVLAIPSSGATKYRLEKEKKREKMKK